MRTENRPSDLNNDLEETSYFGSVKVENTDQSQDNIPP